ncbi:MAG: histidine phosphatase family protein [Bacteroidales bacterium]|nr:histidine phosphatase family protein [Bacteroidales bacterium]
MKLYITRHGETIENTKGILQGHSEGTLSEKGVRQAEKLARRLVDEPIDIIYSSDLGRAAHTTNAIMKVKPGTAVIYTPELRERDLGEFQGRTREECGWIKQSGKQYPEPEKGEKAADVFNRAEKFYRYLLAKHVNDNVLLVSHGFIGKLLTGIITGKTIDDIIITESLKNTSLSIYEIKKQAEIKTIIFDSTDHLF